MVQGLLEKGYAYQVNGDVFYDVSQFKDYGKLSGHPVWPSCGPGPRLRLTSCKNNPMDFALEKGQTGGSFLEQPLGTGKARLAH